MHKEFDVVQARTAIENKLNHIFATDPATATHDEFYKAVSLVVKEKLHLIRGEASKRSKDKNLKNVYYLCMEFLVGRSLKNNLYNLGLEETFKEALKSFDITLDSLYEQEPDAGLGNGGLGRLAACFMDSLATGGYPAMGYSLRYEYGIFKQKMIDGWQTELPDFWLPGGEVWLQKLEERAMDVKFGGYLETKWQDGYYQIEHKDATIITAIPYDMYISGKGGENICILRIWKSVDNNFDMKLFNGGNYLKALEKDAMAEAITKVLYPEDNHNEGKTLRLEQQYFLVSASVQDIIRRHLYTNSSLDNLAECSAIHMNDTHPVLAIPEMMRIMLDECGYEWDDAWAIVTKTIAYTNHTLMSEALETWKCDMFKVILPRIYQIVEEINRRFWEDMREQKVAEDRIWRMSPINDGYVKMANLAVVASHSVNGVSALHSELLKDSLFNDFYTVTPDKFKNVTNGIAHRRWLCQSNPDLSALITELIGNEFVYDASNLEKLMKYKDNKTVLDRLEQIKHSNKVRLAERIKKTQGIIVNPNSIFDVQVKRLHEYKRQHMNALHILSIYNQLKANPNMPYEPHTFFFGAKAAPGYYFAKEIMQFICKLADTINNDPDVNDKLNVVFVENYNVSWAELLTPAAEISEQISLAGTEASGTSNMKFMINGALTLGTLDGATVEIHESVGDNNIFLFGVDAEEVQELRHDYNPRIYLGKNMEIRDCLISLNKGFGGMSFSNLANYLLNNDNYMALVDFADYAKAQAKAVSLYADNKDAWNKMSLVNIAKAGRFSSDRSISDYERTIWHGKSFLD